MKLLMFFFIFCISYSTNATLGEKIILEESSIKNYKLKSQSFLEVSFFSHEYINQDGILIKEFYDSNNIVFAVKWSGIHHPELQSLLGKYWGQYSKTSDRNGPRRVPTLKVITEDIVIEKGGTMRNVFGIAYIPSLVPKGVIINEIQ